MMGTDKFYLVCGRGQYCTGMVVHSMVRNMHMVPFGGTCVVYTSLTMVNLSMHTVTELVFQNFYHSKILRPTVDL